MYCKHGNNVGIRLCVQSLLITSDKIAGFDVRVCHRRDRRVYAPHCCPCPRNEQEDLRPEVRKHTQNLLLTLILSEVWVVPRLTACSILIISLKPLQFSFLRRDGTLWWARPDTKTQVTCEYYFDNGACIPTRFALKYSYA